MEALRTRVDQLQWDLNRLKAENRRLREENPDAERIMALEAELEGSKGEVARLTERVGVCEQQMQEAEDARTAAAATEMQDGDDSELKEVQAQLRATAERLAAERETTSDLQGSLRRMEERESELLEVVEAREEELHRRNEEEEREREARELQHYRALDSVREKWEVREQRALEEVDRWRRDKGGWGGVNVTTLSGQLEEALGEQVGLREELCKYQGLAEELKGQLEEHRLVKEELEAELEFARAKVRRLERCGPKSSEGGTEDAHESSGADSLPGSLDVRAPVFTPRVSVPTTSVTLTPATTVPCTVTPRTNADSLSTTTMAVTPTLPSTSETSLAHAGGVRPPPTPVHGILRSTTVAQTLAAMAGATSTTMSSSSAVPSHVDPVATGLTTSYAGVGHPAPVLAVTSGLEVASAPTSLTSAGVIPTSVTATGVATTSSAGVIPTSLAMSAGVPQLVSCIPPAANGLGVFYPVLPSNLPQIPNFYGGEQRHGETFEVWVDQFESVARIAGWNQDVKLVHLTTALRGTAKSFYRSCSQAQRSDYTRLVDALKKRFTPVKLTALQTQLFHSRRQGATESVDDFAQELRRLHSKAYSTATSANPEAEQVGQIVLVNQFVSGLRAALQAKVVGVEGSMDEMIAKARFEETKRK